MESPVIIYGAGGNANESFEHLTSVGIMPVCFCDGDKEKIGKTMSLHNPYGEDAKLLILSIEDALEKYPDAKLYISPKFNTKWLIIDELLSKGIISNTDCILNKEKDVVKGCAWTEALQIYLHKNTNSIVNHICCLEYTQEIILGSGDAPVDDDTIKANIQKYFDRREDFRAKGGFERCKNCTALTNVKRTDTINRIILDGNAFCSFKCKYCPYENFSIKDTESTHNNLVKYYNELEKQGKIAEDFTFAVCFGEISVNPIKDKYLDFIIKANGDKKRNTQITSNCCVYDEKIAYLLRTGGMILVSLDAGTRETFKTVRGVDAYEKVCENIRKYIKDGNVFVKYIFMVDGSNAADEDIDGFIEFIEKEIPFAAVFSIDALSSKPISYAKDLQEDVFRGMVRLAKGLKKINQNYTYMPEFVTPDLMNSIEKEAVALLCD
jgi:pyruvate-formate lyase-activating enzyme